MAAVAYYRSPLNRIPGPLLARLSPFWLAYHTRVKDRRLAVEAAHKKYGPIIRLTPSHVSVSDPEAISVVFRRGAGVFPKSAFYHAFNSGKPSIFSTVDEEDHHRKRKIIAPALSYDVLRDFTQIMDIYLERFSKTLNQKCSSPVFDLLPWIHYLIFDMTSHLSVGQPMGMLDAGNDLVSIQRDDGSVVKEHAYEIIDLRDHLSELMGIHPLFRYLVHVIPDPYIARARNCTSGLYDFARRHVSQRLATTSCPQDDDILQRLVDARGGSHDVENVKQLISDTLTLLAGGPPTTSATLGAVVFLVMSRPAVYLKLLEELEVAVPASNSTPLHEHVKDLPYLQACIYEGLRWHSTMAVGLPRVVPDNGVVLCGIYLPPGTEVSIPAYTIEHDPEIWGDPEAYRPERWLGEDRAQLMKYLMAFGQGTRACIGRNLAYMQMQLTLATIFLNYHIQLVDDYLKTDETFVHKVACLNIRLTRRERSASPSDAGRQQLKTSI
ncbi:cytochrome P450 [Fistulina hepatica ATCC 64428]|uniref:Cytochrome P450 n=1 Tax=Fistulina hepatica ATCC 64428 TaxID=1128425 RepID=A0A0D7AH82_9AGAR|nr:cytochrome P450 [Fistulina hepatica ATCC 64428]